jgi:hypothetical protein
VIDLTYAEAIEKAEHLKALGETTIYLYREKAQDFPFDKVSRVEEGSSWRSGMPNSCYLCADVDGLTFKLNIDFEPASANGSSAALLDRDKMRELFIKLPPKARHSFAELLETQCLPAMVKRTSEYRAALNKQADSEDCVRGLIAFAREKEAA